MRNAKRRAAGYAHGLARAPRSRQVPHKQGVESNGHHGRGRGLDGRRRLGSNLASSRQADQVSTSRLATHGEQVWTLKYIRKEAAGRPPRRAADLADASRILGPAAKQLQKQALQWRSTRRELQRGSRRCGSRQCDLARQRQSRGDGASATAHRDASCVARDRAAVQVQKTQRRLFLRERMPCTRP